MNAFVRICAREGCSNVLKLKQMACCSPKCANSFRRVAAPIETRICIHPGCEAILSKYATTGYCKGHFAVWDRMPNADARLKEMYEGGARRDEIAKELGVSEGAIAGRANRLGLKRPADQRKSKPRSEVRQKQRVRRKFIQKHGRSMLEVFYTGDGEATQVTRKSGLVDVEITPASTCAVSEEAPVTPRPSALAAPSSLSCCQWPMWPTHQRPGRNPPFCGKEITYLGSPYCCEHEDIAWSIKRRAA